MGPDARASNSPRHQQAAQPPAALPPIRGAVDYASFKSILRELTPILRDVIADRRAHTERAAVVERFPRYERAFTWLHESYRQLERDLLRFTGSIEGERYQFHRYLVSRKAAECELQLAELREIDLDQRRATANRPGQPHQRWQDPVHEAAQRVAASYEVGIRTLGAAAALLGSESCFDLAELRIRMLSAERRLQRHYQKHGNLFDPAELREREETNDSRLSVLKLHTAKTLAEAQLSLTRLCERSADGDDQASRIKKQLELLEQLKHRYEQLCSAAAPHVATGPVTAPEAPADLKPPPPALGWKGVALEHGIPEEKLTEERRWILNREQHFLLSRFHGSDESASTVPHAALRDFEQLAVAARKEGFAVASAADAQQRYYAAVEHLKRFDDGWHWLASVCGCPLRALKNRFKLAAPADAEAALLYFGIGGPREAPIDAANTSSAPLRVTTFIDTIRGNTPEALHSLRTRRSLQTYSPRLKRALEALFVPQSEFNEVQLSSHITALNDFLEFNNHDAVLDLVLNCARYLHHQGPLRDDLWRASEQFIAKIPVSLWRIPPDRELSAAVSGTLLRPTTIAAGDSALSTIIRTVCASEKIGFLGEMILGTQLKLYSAAPTADQRKYEAARELYITAKYALVAGISKEFSGAYPREELIHEALPALIAAVESVEPALGLRFSSHAYWPIRGAMKRYTQRETREATGLPMKTQDKLERFERDCERAGLYAQDLKLSNTEMTKRLSSLSDCAPYTAEEVRRLRSLLYLQSNAELPGLRSYVPGSKISMNRDLEPTAHGGSSAPEREIPDPTAPPPRDSEALAVLTDRLQQAWFKQLYNQHLDPAQLARDLEIYGRLQFSQQPKSAPEIAALTGVSVQTVRRAIIEVRSIIRAQGLSLAAADAELIPQLIKGSAAPKSAERNLQIFRLSAMTGTSTKDLAAEIGIDESTVRLIYRRMRAAADSCGITAETPQEVAMARLKAHLEQSARERAEREAKRRMLVVLRVAQNDEETLDDIGNSFGFSGSNVRQIMLQARQIAEQAGLKEI